MKYIHELKVGIVAIIAIILLIVAIYAVQKITLKREGYEIEVIFNRVAGLTAGGKVFLAGVIVGEVKSVYLREDGRVSVRLIIDPKVKIKENSRFIITMSSLLAIEKVVEIIPGEGKSDYLKPDVTVLGEDPLEVRELLFSAKETFDQFSEISDSLNRLLKKGKVEATLIETLENANNVAKNLILLTENINREFEEGDVRHILDDVKRLSNNLKAASEEVLEVVEDEKIKGDVKEIVSSLKEITDRINNVTNKLEKGVFKDENIKNISDTLKETSKLTKEITASIDKLKKTEFTTNLSTVHLQDFEKWRTNLSLIYHTPTLPTYYKLGITDVTESNKFNLMIGKRRNTLSTELGIFDGKLGAGIKYDKELLLECHFINPNSPYVNCQTGLRLLPNIYLIYGNYKESKEAKRDTFLGIKAVR